MQSYTNIADTKTITESRQLLLDNDATVMSNNSGTTFPTADLQVGMWCFRTDQNKLYQLTALTPVWTLRVDCTKNIAYGDGTNATGTWSIAISGNAGSATNATNVGVTNDTTTNASLYLAMVAAATGNNAVKVSSSKLSFNPSTGTLTSAGDITNSSDERLKTNWRDLVPGFIKKLAGVKMGVYDRTDFEATQVGVSAQSLRDVLPEAVGKDDQGMLNVSYAHAALAACVAMARELVELRARVESMQGA